MIKSLFFKIHYLKEINLLYILKKWQADFRTIVLGTITPKDVERMTSDKTHNECRGLTLRGKS